MTTSRFACGCVIAAIVFFSCTNQPDSKQVPALTQEKKRTTEALPEHTAINFHELNKNFLEHATSRYKVSSRKKTVLTAPKGLRVTVNPGALETVDGSKMKGDINVSIIELTNSNDLFLANAATVSNGRMLASGGSYFIGMDCSGTELKIKQGKAIDVDFPQIADDDMELFYGQRDEQQDMNWQKAEVAFKEPQITFSGEEKEDYILVNPGSKAKGPFASEAKIVYNSLDDSVRFYDQKMRLAEMVDTINKKEQRVCLEVLDTWPLNGVDMATLDYGYMNRTYGPRIKYILRSYHASTEQQKKYDQWAEQSKNTAPEYKKVKYYNTTAVGNLGWLNCDRFYNRPQVPTEVEFPVTLRNTRIETFIVYKSVMGMMKKSYAATDDANPVLTMAKGEPVRLISFAKKDNIYYKATQDLVAGSYTKIKIDLKPMEEGELKKMLAGNTKM